MILENICAAKLPVITVTGITKTNDTISGNFANELEVDGREIQTDENSQIKITVAEGKISDISELKDGWLNADFTDGLKINGTSDGDLIKIIGQGKTSADADGKISISDIEPGTVIEQSGAATGMAFKLDATRKILSLGENYQISCPTTENSALKVTCEENITTLSNSATVTAPADKVFKLAAASYTVNNQSFTFPANGEDFDISGIVEEEAKRRRNIANAERNERI